MDYTPKDPDFEARVRETFRRQKVMETFGASLTHISPGRSEIRLPIGKAFAQWDGFLHTGVIASILDSACGYATISLSPPGVAVLAVEFKVNFLSPAGGEAFVVRAVVERIEGELATCTADGFSVANGEEKLVATMLSTIMTAVRPGARRQPGAARGQPGIQRSYVAALATSLNHKDGKPDPVWLMGSSAFAFSLKEVWDCFRPDDGPGPRVLDRIRPKDSPDPHELSRMGEGIRSARAE